jgi:hypothetical protein
MSEKMALNESQLKNILAVIGMENARDINIKEILRQDPSQIILIAEFINGNPEGKLLAYVNFKQGYPTTDQVFDSIYGAGNGCDLRIILYNNRHGYDGKNPTAADLVVEPAMSELNNYQANLLLVETDENSDRFRWINHDDDGLYKNDPEFSFSNLPSAEQYRAEEFWSYYFDSFNECFYEPWLTFENGFRSKDDWGHELYIDPIGRIPVYWRDDGVKYVISKWYDNYGDLEKVLFAARSEIISRYGKGNVSFRYDRGALEMVIQYSVVPFSWIMIATPSEKMEFAEKLHAINHPNGVH